VGFGSEILFLLALGLLVLGPKRMHAMLGQVARAKAQFEEVTRGFKSQLAAEFDAAHPDGKTDDSHDWVQGSEPSINSASEVLCVAPGSGSADRTVADRSRDAT
jgi:Sec-independent protein translocase protein TatA